MNRYWRELRTVIERHGGAVEKFMGDAVMAVFGIPRVQEDDALRAVRAAAEIRERLPAVAAEVGVALTFRTAVNTGLVLVGDGANLAIGDAINVAARLEQIAGSRARFCSAKRRCAWCATPCEVESLEPLVLKGKSEPVAGVSAGARRSGGVRALRAAWTCRWSVASVSWVWFARRGSVRSTSPGAICSRCWARPGWGSRGWSQSCLPSSATRPRC